MYIVMLLIITVVYIIIVLQLLLIQIMATIVHLNARMRYYQRHYHHEHLDTYYPDSMPFLQMSSITTSLATVSVLLHFESMMCMKCVLLILTHLLVYLSQTNR